LPRPISPRPARHAVERAFYLAAGSGGELYILHAMELDTIDGLREMLGDDLHSVKASLNGDARARLDQLTGDAAIIAVSRREPGSPRETRCPPSPTRPTRWMPCLLVLGARGDSFLRHALLGSTAGRLLRKSMRRPVLVVKQAPREAYSSIVIAVDFSPVSLRAISVAREIAPNADLILVHAFELPYEGKLAFAGVDEQVIRRYVAKEGEGRASGCTTWRPQPTGAHGVLGARRSWRSLATYHLPGAGIRRRPNRSWQAWIAHRRGTAAGQRDQARACRIAVRCAGHMRPARST
jgi:nucleotide-binding universal stress UspA family protein